MVPYRTHKVGKGDEAKHVLTLVPIKGANNFNILFETNEVSIVQSNSIKYLSKLHKDFNNANTEDYKNKEVKIGKPFDEVKISNEKFDEIQNKITEKSKNQYIFIEDLKILDSPLSSTFLKDKIYTIYSGSTTDLNVRIVDVFGDFVTLLPVLYSEIINENRKIKNSTSVVQSKELNDLDKLLTINGFSKEIVNAIIANKLTIKDAINGLKLLSSVNDFENLPKNSSIIIAALTSKHVIFKNISESIKNTKFINLERTLNENMESFISNLLNDVNNTLVPNSLALKQAIINAIVNKFSETSKFGSNFSKKLSEFYVENKKPLQEIIEANTKEVSKVSEKIKTDRTVLPQGYSFEELQKEYPNLNQILEIYNNIDYLKPESDLEMDYASLPDSKKFSIAISIAEGEISVTCTL